MTIQNLAIVFGPTLFGQMMPYRNGANGQMNGGMADAALQNKVRSHFRFSFGRGIAVLTSSGGGDRLSRLFLSIIRIYSSTKRSRPRAAHLDEWIPFGLLSVHPPQPPMCFYIPYRLLFIYATQ
jgi:hypothetical protein